MRVLILLVMFSMCFVSSVFCAESCQGFEKTVDTLLNEFSVPGAVVAVIVDGDVICSYATGFSDIESQKLVDPNTKFQIASNTKFFTAALCGILVDRQMVGWDVPVRQYISEFALSDHYAGRHASLRDFLSHRSGLKEYDGGLLGRFGYGPRDIIRRIQFLEMGSSFREKAMYSNLGFFIAGEVCARLLQTSWENAMDKELLAPLGMHRSSAWHKSTYADENYARGYRLDNGKAQRMELEQDALPAAGSIVSTLTDMTAWAQMLVNEGMHNDRYILSPETVRDILAPSMLTNSPGLVPDCVPAKGLGCENYTYNGVRVIEKNGALDGARSIVVIVPERKAALVVMANLHLTVFPEVLRAEFLEKLLGKYEGIDLVEKVKQSQTLWDTLGYVPEPPEDVPAPSRALEDFAGQYISPLYGRIGLWVENGQLHALCGPSRYPAKLRHWSDNNFQIVFENPDDPNDIISFEIDSKAQVSGFSGAVLGSFRKMSDEECKTRDNF